MRDQIEFKKALEKERHDGFVTGVLFTLFSLGMIFLAWFIVFAPMGWWMQ